jgi:hypothetical protein
MTAPDSWRSRFTRPQSQAGRALIDGECGFLLVVHCERATGSGPNASSWADPIARHDTIGPDRDAPYVAEAVVRLGGTRTTKAIVWTRSAADSRRRSVAARCAESGCDVSACRPRPTRP